VADSRIVKIEGGTLVGERPRAAGSNSHMAPLGKRVRVPIVRVTLDDGSSGWGLSRAEQSTAQGLVGAALSEAFDQSVGVTRRFRPIEYAIWDVVGRRAGQPVYALASAILKREAPASPARVPCYDTTLYIDDLHLDDHEAGAAFMAEEAMQGWRAGHRNFKIKVGRNNVHMPTEAGLRRDIAVVNAIRAAVGPEAAILTDANNGYTVNIAWDFLKGTADSKVFWLEEAFYEDAIMYRQLRARIKAEGLATLIADGEGRGLVDVNAPDLLAGVEPAQVGASAPLAPAEVLLEMVREGIVDVLQWDVLAPGLSRWLEVAHLIEQWGRLAAPHHYGTHLGNYIGAQIGLSLPRFAFVEWDEVTTPGIDASGYKMVDGYAQVPDAPGFGLSLDEDLFGKAVREGGFALTV
jgi:L-alanine-DL-glutamate epimerase-like enolase superfamily enzyme